VATVRVAGSRFSLPPWWEGLRLLLAELSRGVSDASRVGAAVRGRLLCDFWWLVESAFDGCCAVFCFDFASGFSGMGHSTSWERSSRSAETHSSRRLLNST
jgi:hypothetical protein